MISVTGGKIQNCHVGAINHHSYAEDQRILSLAGEKGASSWLIPLHLRVFGFCLHKRAFFDALALRYGWLPQQFSVNCACGVAFSVEYALSCRKEGYPSIRHNEIYNLTARVLTEVCNDVLLEPPLQPLTGEKFPGASINTSEGARLDISFNGFRDGKFEKTFVDVRVFNPHAPSICRLKSVIKNMRMKRKEPTRGEFWK